MIRLLCAISLFVTTLALNLTPTAHAVENTWDYSVQVSSAVQASPAKITLSWPQDTNGTPASYTISRKAPTDTSWSGGTTIAGTATSYTDTSVTAGTAYEYRIVKAGASYTGYGYILTGVNAPLVENRGKVILIVDQTFTSSLATELARLQQDLVGDGWTVLRHDVPRTASVATVKNLIVAAYNADPAKVKSVFLFGHIAVPYSGQFNPDGHPDHTGAWPADVYYGDVDGNWTDSSVNYRQTLNTDPADAARISNLPGDGKFDQNDIPSHVELQVGRVDLANMPGRTVWGGPATFPTETELLRNYLNKDHDFRHRVTSVPRRAILGDYFGSRGGEAFAASGFRSFAPLVGASSIRNLNIEFNDQKGVWIPQSAQNQYLLAYACGAGSYATMGGLGSTGLYHDGSTTELVSNNVRGVFNLLFGSWLGDWDHEDNLLRAPLATSSGLVSVWSGRPHWFIHAMGLGQTIGFSTQATQNNAGLYQTQINSAAHRTHIALMGDPTLRLHPVAPAGSLNGSASGSTVALTWGASPDTNLLGYHVYRASSTTAAFTRLTASPVTSTSFADTTATTGATYMVRAIKLEDTTSGSYLNPSQGIFWTAGSVSGGTTPPVATTDSTAPGISLAAPAPNAIVSGSTVTVSATATDNVAVTGVQFKLNGANLGGEVTSAPYRTTLNTTALANGTHTLGAVARDAAGNMASASNLSVTVSNVVAGNGSGSGSTPPAGSGTTTSTPVPVVTPSSTPAGTVVWFDDALPGGTAAGNAEGWNWVSSNPAPYSGTVAHQSALASGLHEHSFSWSTPLAIKTAEVLFTYVYLDPANPPSEIMLSWVSNSWEHRAYWGANKISYGTNGTASRLHMGALPVTGQWVRLEVPASAVALEGASITGMAFSTFDGRATWDYTGKGLPTAPALTVAVTPPTSGAAPANSASLGITTSFASITSADTIWVEDKLPASASGAGSGGDTWNWVTASPAPLSGSKAHQSAIAAGLHEHYFSWASPGLTVPAGGHLFAYVYLDPANLPAEIMLSWHSNNWEHRAYWGADRISYGTNGTASRFFAGDLPPAGAWVRLQIPASAVGLDSATITGMSFSAFGGRVTWDAIGKSTAVLSTTAPSTTPAPATTPSAAPEVAWFDDSLPAGAQGGGNGGDSWNWVSANPAPISGSVAHQSAVAAGLHEHHFSWASSPLTVAAGDRLFAWVYVDPANLPSEIMLSWFADNWEHRAYWGADKISYGTNGTASRRAMGAIPAAGQWVRLEIPASAVGLEGQAITGMSFSLFGGRATWDKTGKGGAVTGGTVTPPVATTPPAVTTPPVVITPPVVTTPPVTTTPPTTSTPPSTVAAENTATRLPLVGENQLRVISPTILEVQRITTKDADPAPVSAWNFVDGSGNFAAPAASAFAVTVNGQAVSVKSIGFRRRVAYAPLLVRDLRIDNCLYLELNSAIADGQAVEVKNPGAALWPAAMTFTATADPLRYSPAIHVNQEGYVPTFPKKAIVGYFLGSKGELDVSPSAGFKLVTAATGAVVYSGVLRARPETGYTYSPQPYQKVLEADFSAFTAPGEYQIVVPGLGASLPFLINDGVAMAFTRTYALGLYHQRDGVATELPYTRFTHIAGHTAASEIPSPQSAYSFTWSCIASKNGDAKNNPRHTAPQLKDEASQLYPFVNKGVVDTAGGHMDAGDYSKYTVNSAQLVHELLFTADSIEGAGLLDNLGLPESGDGIGDILQEAKREADFVAKLQDADGGFYFIVYPKNREYENNVDPGHGDLQVVWPKNTAATAASVAALAEMASSPRFKAAYPAEAASYLAKARLGWQFLINAIARHGKDGSYQKITFYGDNFMHDDELAWAAAALFAATGESQYQTKLQEWMPNPSDPATFRWGWWRMSERWGNAIRTYAFAARSGRLPAAQLNVIYLASCEAQIKAAGDDALTWTTQSAYPTAFPKETKNVLSAGWYFSLDQASDMAVAYQLNPRAEYLDALVGNMNYEGGLNPVNVTYLTGVGTRRQHETVSQWAINDRQALPPIGIPLGNVQSNFDYLSKYGAVGNELAKLSFPTDANGAGTRYPFYDRWADTWNVTTEFVTVNQGRALKAVAMLAAQTSAKVTPWKPAATIKINVPTATAPVGEPLTLTFDAAGLDLAQARITWEARDQQPDYGPTFTIVPTNNGAQWVEVEITWADGRRLFGSATFNANAPVMTWVDDAIPAGATTASAGGDTWNWVTNNVQSGTKAHQSALAAGLHEHAFMNVHSPLVIGAGDKLFVWVYLDAANMPEEIMLNFNDGSSWEHRAFWGADRISNGTLGTASRFKAGALPAGGAWVRLEVAASAVGLEGRSISGMSFSAFGGRVTWDTAGKTSPMN